MAERGSTNLQGFKTIREMQESFQNTQDLQNEKIILQERVQETQKILSGEANKEVIKSQQDFPNIANAKTIKESMEDWIDDEHIKLDNNKDAQKQSIDNLVSNSLSKDNVTILNSKNANAKINQQINNSLNNESLHIQNQQRTKAIENKQASNNKVIQEELLNIESDVIESKQEKYKQIVENNSSNKQETWLLLDEFLRLSGLEKEKVEELINDKVIKSKEEGGRIYVEASTGTSALIKKVENRLVSIDMNGNALDPVFVEKTIATILGLHDKVLSSKDETISAFKSENSFLKEALVSMQEIYDDDKKTIEILRQQLQKTQEEVEFVKRKYKLMWGKVSNSTT